MINSKRMQGLYQSSIPISNDNFQRILLFYLFECPVKTFNRVKKEKENPVDSSEQPHPKYNYHFKRVSYRGLSFADRGISGGKLNSFRAAMKRVADTNIILRAVDEITDIDSNHEYIIIKRNVGNVSDTEGFFYCIRNAFAHGSFEVSESRVYYFDNYVGDMLKGKAKIREKTLLAWIDLFNSDVEQLKSAGK